MICPNNRYVCTAIGRLDNRTELATLLKLPPQYLASLADDALLFKAFLHWGKDCLQHMIGDFALAIWDKTEQELFIARDQMGAKPLFYYQTDTHFFFASNVNAIKAVNTLTVNEKYLAFILGQKQLSAEVTCYTHLFRLLPAHYATVKNDVFKQVRYWELQAQPEPHLTTDEDYYNRFQELFEEAVRCRTRSLYGVGCQLSGGLDSSAITMLAARCVAKERLHTYSYVMPEHGKTVVKDWVNEEPEQEAVIEKAGILRQNVHKITQLHYKTIEEELERCLAVSGGIAETDCYWQDSIFKEAREQSVRMVLSGFPGDEMVSNGSRLWFYDLIYNRKWKGLFKLWRKKPLRMPYHVGKYFYYQFKGSIFPKFRKIEKERSILAPTSPYQNSKGAFDAFPFSPSFRQYLKKYVCRPHTALRMESEGLYALENGMETSYPLADIRLLAFVLGAPLHLFEVTTQPRPFFVNATKGILPEMVRLRVNKKGAPLVFHELKTIQEFETIRKVFARNRTLSTPF